MELPFAYSVHFNNIPGDVAPGKYGSRSQLIEENGYAVLEVTFDPQVPPAESLYPITVGL